MPIMGVCGKGTAGHLPGGGLHDAHPDFATKGGNSSMGKDGLPRKSTLSRWEQGGKNLASIAKKEG